MSMRFPAEWEPQAAVMLTWPHIDTDWAPLLSEVEPVFVKLAHSIARYEKVVITCCNEQHQNHIRALLNTDHAPLATIKFYSAASNDSWVRDHGPITVLKDNEAALLDFQFNGWGNKYAAELDNNITKHLHTQGAFGATPIQKIYKVLEGGGIETDGQGTLLTTSRCLLSLQRNPELDRQQWEICFTQWLGIKKVLWLDYGYLAGDDTDSHIDTLARFCDPQTIAYVSCSDPNDEHYQALKAMEQQLQTFTNLNNQAYRLVPLPWPQAKYNAEGKRLPATYANFLIINQAVLVPTYDDPQDNLALAQLALCFPQHKIIAINCLPLIYQFGSLHCVTMQLPRQVLLP